MDPLDARVGLLLIVRNPEGNAMHDKEIFQDNFSFFMKRVEENIAVIHLVGVLRVNLFKDVLKSYVQYCSVGGMSQPVFAGMEEWGFTAVSGASLTWVLRAEDEHACGVFRGMRRPSRFAPQI